MKFTVGKRFIHGQQGGIAIMFGLMVPVLLALLAGVIDFHRAGVAKTRLQAAIDAAVLAAAASPTMSDDERIALAEKTFEANFPADKFGVSATPAITIDGNGAITGTASADLPTLVLDLFGIKALDLGSLAVAGTPSLVKGEIALVLDYSSSMDCCGKYEAMRDAAVKLVETLSNNKTNSDLKFALVPFAEHVYGTMESDFIVNEVPGGTWTNCTKDRMWPFNIQDTTPLPGVDDSKWGMKGDAKKDDDDKKKEKKKDKGKDDDDDDDDDDKKKKKRKKDADEGSDAYADCSEYPARSLVIRPLTNDHAGTIAQLQAMYPRWGTHISLGLAFGWHVLSANPPWTEGVAYGTADTLKAIVLLTDGRQSKGGNGPGASNNVEQAEKNLEDMCTAIKAKGVTMITVAFDLKDKETKNRLLDCASQSELFFDADTNSDLNSAFEQITGALVKSVYLTK